VYLLLGFAVLAPQLIAKPINPVKTPPNKKSGLLFSQQATFDKPALNERQTIIAD
jgi:hypothetical protein